MIDVAQPPRENLLVRAVQIEPCDRRAAHILLAAGVAGRADGNVELAVGADGRAVILVIARHWNVVDYGFEGIKFSITIFVCDPRDLAPARYIQGAIKEGQSQWHLYSEGDSHHVGGRLAGIRVVHSDQIAKLIGDVQPVLVIEGEGGGKTDAFEPYLCLKPLGQV